MAAESNMNEVVQRLRVENAEALRELVEFELAFEQFLKVLEHLATAAEELDAATCNIAGANEEADSNGRAIRDLATHLSGRLAQFLGAFRQMHSAVRAWNITEARGPSDPPYSGKRLVPRG